MSYRKIVELDKQLDVAVKDSQESYALIREIAGVVQGFCDAEASKFSDTEIIWEEWEFQGQTVLIKAMEYRRDTKLYNELVEEFEKYLDTEEGIEYCQKNPWGVSASYDGFREQASCSYYVSLTME